MQHNLFLLTFHGELGLSPKVREGAKRVLDIGTGTGVWAMEYSTKAHLQPARDTEFLVLTILVLQPIYTPSPR